MSGEEELSYWLKTQLAAFEEKFNIADKDRSGALQFSEICHVLRAAGFRGTDEDVQAIFRFADTDKNNVISRDEYNAAVKRVPKIDMKQIVLRRAFKKLDTDNSGYLTRDELLDAAASQELGLNFPAQKLADLLLAVTNDSDQKLDYEEFLESFGYDATAEALKNLFNQIDMDHSGFLSKSEILNAIQSDEELTLRAEKISDLLIKFCKDPSAKINYAEFVRVVGDEGKKRK